MTTPRENYRLSSPETYADIGRRWADQDLDTAERICKAPRGMQLFGCPELDDAYAQRWNERTPIPINRWSTTSR